MGSRSRIAVLRSDRAFHFSWKMNLDGQHEEEVKPGDSDSEESPEPEPYDGSNVCRKCHFPLKSSYRVAGKKGTKSIRHDRCACCVVFLTGCVCAGKVAQNARTLQIASSKPGTKTTKTNGIPSKSSSVFFVTSFSIVMESIAVSKRRTTTSCNPRKPPHMVAYMIYRM